MASAAALPVQQAVAAAPAGLPLPAGIVTPNTSLMDVDNEDSMDGAPASVGSASDAAVTPSLKKVNKVKS